ncbi:MAG TPA: hypothetical protein VGL13_00995 [Polyangiaceae bacterium]|jgi:hypothetical protein
MWLDDFGRDAGFARAHSAARASDIADRFFPLIETATAEVEKPKAVAPHGRRYTDSPYEVPAKTTSPSAGEVFSAMREMWPELTEQGARTLVAQFQAETANGAHCYNWNLGNVKAGPNDAHMYLRNVWEVETGSVANADVARSQGLAHVATVQEMKQHGWACPPGSSVVVYQPPHAQCRFRAYASLADGARKWLDYHKALARKDPGMLTALDAGDTAAFAHALKKARCYTAAESLYARLLAAKKAEIDRVLDQA